MTTPAPATTSPALVERLLPTSQASQLIGFSNSYLEHDRLRSAPLVPFVRIGRAVRYRHSDLLAFMESPAAA